MRTFFRMLAFVCQICPMCIAARRYPKSRFALMMAKLEKACPFCRAYAKLHQKTGKGVSL